MSEWWAFYRHVAHSVAFPQKWSQWPLGNSTSGLYTVVQNVTPRVKFRNCPMSIGHSSVMSVGNFMFNLSTINSINMYSPLLQQENYKLQYIQYKIHTYCIHKTSFTTNICIWWILYNNTRFSVYKQILHFNVHIQRWSPLNKKVTLKAIILEIT